MADLLADDSNTTHSPRSSSASGRPDDDGYGELPALIDDIRATVIPSSDDFRHPAGTSTKHRLLPALFFGVDGRAIYPTRSPYRCHSCLLPFTAPPLFITTSIQHESVVKDHAIIFPSRAPIRLLDMTGCYCCGGCRERALEESFDPCAAETFRMNIALADLIMFGRSLAAPHILNHQTNGAAQPPAAQPPVPAATSPAIDPASPAAFDLELFGGSVPLRALIETRRRTEITVEDLARIPPNIRFAYKLRGVRETYYGQAEGGDGEQEILRWLREGGGCDGGSGEPSETPPPDPPLISPDTPLAPLLARLPGSPRLATRDGRTMTHWPCVKVDPPGGASANPAAGGPRSPPHLCGWCAGALREGQLLFMVPSHRDLLNTIHLEGAFCSAGCGLAWLLDSREATTPSRRHERIGLYVWVVTVVMGIRYKARPRLAPHRLELVEFGGDMTRREFRLLEQREDMTTALEMAPYVSGRMRGNYARPGVVTDLSSLGNDTFLGNYQQAIQMHPEAPRTTPAHLEENQSIAYLAPIPGMLETLLAEAKATPPPPPVIVRKRGLEARMQQ